MFSKCYTCDLLAFWESQKTKIHSSRKLVLSVCFTESYTNSLHDTQIIFELNTDSDRWPVTKEKGV